MGNCLNSSSANIESTLSTSGISEVSSEMTISTLRAASSSIDNIHRPRRSEGETSFPNLKSFCYLELKNATRNFHPDTRLGKGEFGYVFKGWIDEVTHLGSKPGSGMAIAVKNVKPGPEGFQGRKEWLTEVAYLAQLHHPNLVKLLGYCTEGDKRLLVSEFLPKGSLENHLFRGPQPLQWATRLKVAIGAARGLAFLHDANDQIICLNFKASNILLDAEFNAKLSDFGLAKACLMSDRTHVTNAMATSVYSAPEYISTGRSTQESDVYSFGVVLLELLTGRRVIDKEKVGVEKDLVVWTKPYLGHKRLLFRIMDTRLKGQYPHEAVYTVATLALQCLSTYPRTRPRMSHVLASLEELQTANNVSNDHQTVSSVAPKSPAGHPKRRLTPSAYPLPTPRQSTPV